MPLTEMPFEDYRKIDAVNWSTLKEMDRSPLHFLHALTHPREETPAMRLGRAGHTSVFEPDRFAVEYAVFKGKRRAGKKWTAFKESHEGETILKVEDYDRCLRIRDAVRKNPIAMEYLARGVGEQTAQWTDEDTGIACKGRIDWRSESCAALVDLKTTNAIDERWFANYAARLKYHGQMAFYRAGAFWATGHVLPVAVIAVEQQAPHDVAVYEMDDDALYAGDEDWKRLLARVAECRKANAWPGRFQARQKLRLPTWMWDDDEADTTGLGLTFANGHNPQDGATP